MDPARSTLNLDAAEDCRLHCAFCGHGADETRFLSAGVFGGTICDRCGFAAFAIFLKAHLRAAFRLGA